MFSLAEPDGAGGISRSASSDDAKADKNLNKQSLDAWYVDYISNIVWHCPTCSLDSTFWNLNDAVRGQ